MISVPILIPDDAKAETLNVDSNSISTEPLRATSQESNAADDAKASDHSPLASAAAALIRLRQRRSRLVWWLTAFGVVSLCCVLGCCVGWIGLAMVFGPIYTKEPSEVEAVAQRMAALQLPPHFQPTWGWSADHSLMWFQMARFDHNAKRGLLLVGELHIRPMKNTLEQEQLQQLIEDSSPDLRLIDPKQSESRKLTIRGVEATFEIVTGEDRASTTKLRQVKGSFRGREGIVLLILQAEAEQLSDEAIEGLLSSLATTSEEPPGKAP